MSYSYGRALQKSALNFWSKNMKDIKSTQKFLITEQGCALAAQAKWSQDLENK